MLSRVPTLDMGKVKLEGACVQQVGYKDQRFFKLTVIFFSSSLLLLLLSFSFSSSCSLCSSLDIQLIIIIATPHRSSLHIEVGSLFLLPSSSSLLLLLFSFSFIFHFFFSFIVKDVTAATRIRRHERTGRSNAHHECHPNQQGKLCKQSPSGKILGKSR